MTVIDATTCRYNPEQNYSSFAEVLVNLSEAVVKPQFKTVISSFTDGTINKYIKVSGVGVEFAEHYAKLDSIATDPSLWPEDAERPESYAIGCASEVIGQLANDGLVPTKVVASAEGGVAICFVAGDKYADIECFNSGEMLGVISNKYNRPSAWEIEQNSDGIARATAKISCFLRESQT